MSFQGVEFTPEMRKMVVNVKHFFDTNKKTSSKPAKIAASKLTASALDISESTVKVVMAAFNKRGDDGLNFSNFLQRGRPSYALDSGVEPIVRQFVRRANRNGDQVNVEIIRNFMQDELHCEDIAIQPYGDLCRGGVLSLAKVLVLRS